MPEPLLYDCIVVGAGVEGSATGYQLTKKGYMTLLLEQFKCGHKRGSSHGNTRITRHAYRQYHYAKMMPECFQAWKQLGQEVDVDLYRKIGLLALNGSPYTDYIQRTKNLRSTNSAYEMLTSHDVCRRYPGFSVGPDIMAFIDPEAGVLRADRCLLALQTMFVKQGGVLKEEEKVLEIIPGEAVTIVTNLGRYSAKSVVLTPGAWASTLLRPLGLDPPLKVQRIKVCYWPEKHPGMFTDYPCFYFLSENYETFGMTDGEYPGLVKVCYHSESGESSDATAGGSQGVNTEDMVKLKRFIREYMPGLRDEPALVDNCLYTSTPNSELILDSHPDHSNIVIACGFSGHGFKLAPVVGKILSELATGVKPSYDLPLSKFQSLPNGGRLAAKL